MPNLWYSSNVTRTDGRALFIVKPSATAYCVVGQSALHYGGPGVPAVRVTTTANHSGGRFDMSRPVIKGKYIEFYCDECGKFVRDYASNRRYGKNAHYFCSPQCSGRFKQSGKSKAERDAAHYRRNADRVRQRMGEYYHENKEDIIEKRKQADRELKQEIIDAYGGRCACCGEEMIEFLTIDHINNDGAKHRARVGKGRGVYKDIKAQGFPEGKYQVLCFNCNIARGFYGYCPHHPEDYNPVDKTPKGDKVGRPRTVK